MKIYEFGYIPDEIEPGNHIVKVKPEINHANYKERTDRNLGWITKEEQAMLQKCSIAFAGCGGMGGTTAATVARLGVGRIIIADPEVFDTSNINRQLAANIKTVGKSKALETAKLIRGVSKDIEVIIFPSGINTQTVEKFLNEADLIIDLIEFWAIGARILLHKKAKETGNIILNGNTVGFGTRLFRFNPKNDVVSMEKLLGFELEEALEIERNFTEGNSKVGMQEKVRDRVLKLFAPDLPEYISQEESWSNIKEVNKRLLEEGRASIIATNPVMAAGFLADHILFELLREQSSTKRIIPELPKIPGYLYFDAALRVIEERIGITGQ